MAKTKPKDGKSKDSKTKDKKSKVSGKLRPTLIARNEKRAKVESGVKGLSKATHTVQITSRQFREVYGYLAHVDENRIILKTRAFTGGSRKALFKPIAMENVISFEGKVGDACRALVKAPEILATYKDCRVSYKGNLIILETADGDVVTINQTHNPDISIDISGDAS
tara:strand:- start:440 stop:940 length:501 start_codon:yes stop_codon:yes gene_type:complete